MKTKIANALAYIYKHVKSWPEGYILLPLALLAVIGAAKFVFFLTGRAPLDDPGELVKVALRVGACAVVLLLTSWSKQATSIWLSAEEQKSNVVLAIAHHAKDVIFAYLFAYLILH